MMIMQNIFVVVIVIYAIIWSNHHECVKMEKRKVPTMIGKVMIPMERDVCVEWREIDDSEGRN